MELPATLTSVQFQRLARREGDRIEFKRGVGVDRIHEVIVAFSNTDGGALLIGIEDNGTVVGKMLDGGSEDKIHAAAWSARDVGRYRVSQVEIAGTPVIAVTVDRREEGFAQTSDGRILVRRGAHNVALFGVEVTRFLSERSLRRFELTKTSTPLGDANGTYLNEIAAAHGWGHRRADISDRLKERGLATDGVLTIAGALFLTDPANSLNQAKAIVEIRRYPENDGEFDRREEFGGPLHLQVLEATEFISAELGQDVIVTGVYRHELDRLPKVVIRETIANAVAHRSYELDRTAIIVELRPDRLVVTSPGGLPEPVTVENLRQAQAARNPVVIDVLRRLKLAEDAGRGIDVILDSMAEALLDRPEFADDGHAVRVTLPLRGPITSRERAWVADLERRGEILAPDRLLLVHAARGERLTNARAREALSVDSIAARDSLQRLRDAGLLVQHGSRGGATYTLADGIAPPAAFRLGQSQLAELVVQEAGKRPISNEDVRQLTGLNRREALRLLARLVSERRVRRKGARRGTRYIAR